ncbi:TonB family protein [bacterium]|nr:TonB family protein [bacterium]
MNKQRAIFVLFFLFSFSLHALVFYSLLNKSVTEKKSALWSGGESSSGGPVTFVDLSIGVEGSRGRGVEGTTKKNAAPKNKRVPGFGSGASDTPAGGSGAGLDKGGEVSAIAPSVLASIRKKIMKKKKYPLLAKEQGLSGIVTLNFQINKAGQLDYIKIMKSSGHDSLDQAAISSVQKAVPLPHYTEPIAVALEYRLNN